MPIWLREKLFQKNFLFDLLQELDENFDDIKKIKFSEHHYSHAASALFPSPLKEAIILTLDGVGEWATTTVAMGKDNNLKMLKEIYFPHSLGLLYSAFTYYTGFKVNSGEYKVMGLAAYGKPIYADKLKSTIYIENNKLVLDTSYFDFVRSIKQSYSSKLKSLIGISPRPPHQPLDLNKNNFKTYANLACSAQKVLEDLLSQIFYIAHKETGEKDFHFTGGVAMNSLAVMKLSKLEFIDSLIIPPSPGDSGAAIGAAYYSFLKSHNNYEFSPKIE